MHCLHSGVEACSSRTPLRATEVYRRCAIPRPGGKYRKSKTASSLSHIYEGQLREGGPEAALEDRALGPLPLRRQGDKIPGALFDDLHDATAARLDNHRPIIDDRIPVAWPHMVLAG
jgi:hypothetical protein